MNIQLLIISKLCSEILYENIITCDNPQNFTLDDFYNKIHELHPGLKEEDYILYWRYSEDEIYSIVDYMSFVAALIIPLPKTIFLMLQDYLEPWFDNLYFLEKLDRIELKEKKERERDIYDVKIKRPGEESEEEDDTLDNVEPDVKREDVGIIKFALRNKPQSRYYSCEQQIRVEFVRIITKGTSISLK